MENKKLWQIKASKKFKIKVIEGGYRPKEKVHVSLQIVKQTIEIKIKNEGKGIPEADIPYIFQPFFRAENTAASKGYGIGLSLVERIVNLHLGSISVQSEQNGWTEFTVKFPIAT